MRYESDLLWEQYRKGDQQAFEELYYQQVNALYDFGQRMTRNTPLVEDCIQDLFSELWEKRGAVKPVVSVRSYLLVSLKRKIIRKLNVEQKNSTQSLSAVINSFSDFAPDGHENVAEEQLEYLHQAFTKLSSRQKEVIYLRFYNQLSYEEIADVMSVQVKAVYKLMARAIRMLRTYSKVASFLALPLAILAI